MTREILSTNTASITEIRHLADLSQDVDLRLSQLASWQETVNPELKQVGRSVRQVAEQVSALQDAQETHAARSGEEAGRLAHLEAMVAERGDQMRVVATRVERAASEESEALRAEVRQQVDGLAQAQARLQVTKVALLRVWSFVYYGVSRVFEVGRICRVLRI